MGNELDLELVRKARKRTHEQRVWNKTKVTILLVGMIILGIFLIFPYFSMVSKSFMSEEDLVNPVVQIIPTHWTFQNFINMFTGGADNKNYLSATLISIGICSFNVVATLFSATFIAYGFAKCEFFGKKPLFILMMFTMMLPAAATQIPLFVMYTKMGWLNTVLPFTIPNLFGGGASYIFLLRQYMMGIPHDMEDAARVDGANPFEIFWHVIFPNCKPILIYIGVNVFIGNWGDFYGPLVYYTESSAPKTLAYLVYENALINGDPASAGLRMAAGLFMSLFPAILFTIFQRQLTDGALTAGIKG